MASFRTNSQGKHYPVHSGDNNDQWIQQAINPNDKGQVRERMKRDYGNEAFENDDPMKPLKMSYLEREREIAIAKGDTRYAHQIQAAINLKRMVAARKANKQ
jgi:hypothetical protein